MYTHSSHVQNKTEKREGEKKRKKDTYPYNENNIKYFIRKLLDTQGFFFSLRYSSLPSFKIKMSKIS